MPCPFFTPHTHYPKNKRSNKPEALTAVYNLSEPRAGMMLRGPETGRRVSFVACVKALELSPLLLLDSLPRIFASWRGSALELRFMTMWYNSTTQDLPR